MTDASMGLTELDMAKLAYPFPRGDHSFLQGYVYIEEEAITARLDKVDPNWSISIDEAVGYGDSIAIRSTLTIKGVSRSNVGGNPVQRDTAEKDSKGNKTGTYVPLPLYTQADNGVNAYKAAATDALKRCARMFGVGRYLLSAPKEGGKFDEWLEQCHEQARARHAVLSGIDTSTGEIKRQTNGNGHEPDVVSVEQSSAKVSVAPRPTPPPASPAENHDPSGASAEPDPLADFGKELGAVITATRPDDIDLDLYHCDRLKVNKTRTATQFILFVQKSATKIVVNDVTQLEGLTIDGLPIIELGAGEYPLIPTWSVRADSTGRTWEVHKITADIPV